MPREIPPDSNDDIIFEERFIDAYGDSLTVEFVEVDKKDGIKLSSPNRTPGWLSTSATTSDLATGAKELVLEFTLDATQMDFGTYELVARVSDGTLSNTLSREFSYRSAAGPSSYIWVYGPDGDLHRLDPANGSVLNSTTVSKATGTRTACVGLENGGVAIAGENFIRKYDENDSQVWENTSVPGDIQYMVQDAKGFIWAWSRSNNGVYRINRDGDSLGQILTGPDLNEGGLTPLTNGGVVLTDFNNDSGAVLYDAQGNYVGRTGFTGSGTSIDCTTAKPDGSLLFVCEDRGPMVAYNNSFEEVWRTSLPGRGRHDVHYSPIDDRIYAMVADRYDNATIFVFDPSTGSAVGSKSLEIGFGAEVELDEAQRLYYQNSDNNDNIIVRRDDTGLSNQWQTTINGSDSYAASLGVKRVFG